MSDTETTYLKKIILCYRELGEKKLFKSSIKNLNIDKKVFLIYAKRKNLPICALPKLKLVISSRPAFLTFCYNFFLFANSSETVVPISNHSISCIAKFVIAHEIGHILDPKIFVTKTEYKDIISKIIDKILEYDIDINDSDFYKRNIPQDLDECVIALKKNLVDRESNAWDIAKSLLIFESRDEEVIFNKIKEYALATYNYGNLKNVVRENNLEVFFKYRRYLA